MIPEFEIIGDSVLILCSECGSAGEGGELIVDNRFTVFRCKCSKLNMLPNRFIEKRKRSNIRKSKNKRVKI